MATYVLDTCSRFRDVNNLSWCRRKFNIDEARISEIISLLAIKSPSTTAPILRLSSASPHLAQLRILLWALLNQRYVKIEPKWLRSVHPSPKSTYASPSQNRATTLNKDPSYSKELASAALVTFKTQQIHYPEYHQTGPGMTDYGVR